MATYVIDKRILLVRTIGNALVLMSLVGLGYTFWPIGTAYFRQAFDSLAGYKFEAAPTAGGTTQSFGSLLGKQDPNIKVLVPKDPNFSIIVEKIGADAPIVPNVDASNKDTYLAALRRGVAHALGSSFPGQPGVTYLFAHSTDTIFNVPRFNAIFYLLKDLVPGDPVVIFFAGKRYDYVVEQTKITEPDDVSYFTLKTQDQILVLQTCYPPGTSWKRLLVIAKPAVS
jgi:LPXTG-site transpeptidase (sortase) family protein